jgi:hypothetical protein
MIALACPRAPFQPLPVVTSGNRNPQANRRVLPCYLCYPQRHTYTRIHTYIYLQVTEVTWSQARVKADFSVTRPVTATDGMVTGSLGRAVVQ